MPNNSRPSKGRKAYDNTNSPTWKFVSTSKSGFFVSTSNDNNSQYSYNILAGYLENTLYQEVTLKATSNSPYELFLDGEKIISYNEFCNEENNTKDKKIKLEIGKHDILVKTLYQKKEDCSWEFKLEFGSEDINTLSWDLNPRKEMDLNTVMHGIRTTGVSISPNGKYAKYS